MRERWNHPCVMIWDASNETRSTETGPAIAQVRSLDLSNRPWDNSYNPPQEPGDVHESHPYHFNPSFRLRNLATADPVPQGNMVRNDGEHAVIINEYGWHWVNRDGTPTTLTRDIYRSVLGENATAAQRFHMQATWLAADTEFWRCTARPPRWFTSPCWAIRGPTARRATTGSRAAWKDWNGNQSSTGTCATPLPRSAWP